MARDREILFSRVRPYLSGGFLPEEHYVLIREGRIIEISKSLPTKIPSVCQQIDGEGCYLSPGFWDLQSNGGFGVDLLSASVEEIQKFLRQSLRSGVTTIFPTVITDSPERMAQAIRNITQVKDNSDQARIGGIHIEGPMISSGPGKGCHPVEHIRPLTWEEYRHWQEISGGKIAIITLAPEVEGALDFIPRLVSDGVVVGIGHTDASKEVIIEATNRGAKLATHLWNACKKKLARDLEHIGVILVSDQLYASFIVDGHHIHSDTLAISFRVKPHDKIILVTDAMAGAGAPDGQYRLGDLEVNVVDGIARDPNEPTRLAGSTLTMDRAIFLAVKTGKWSTDPDEVSRDDAVKMATENPACLMLEHHSEKYQLKEGNPADLVLFYHVYGMRCHHPKLNIRYVVRNGKLHKVTKEERSCPFCGSAKVEKGSEACWYVDDLGPAYAPIENEWLCWDCGAFFDSDTRQVRVFGFTFEATHPSLIRSRYRDRGEKIPPELERCIQRLEEDVRRREK